jgi:hypothetical protein
MKLKRIQVCLNTENGFAGWADEVGISRNFLAALPFDDFQVIARVGPNPTAISAFECILAVTV